MLSNKSEPEIGYSGFQGYIYASVIDSIKEMNLKPKDFRTQVMQIGRLRFMDDEAWKKYTQELEREEAIELQHSGDDTLTKAQNTKLENQLVGMFGKTTRAIHRDSEPMSQEERDPNKPKVTEVPEV